MSRGAAVRGQHPNRPRHSEGALLEFMLEQRWDPQKFANMSINQGLLLSPLLLFFLRVVSLRKIKLLCRGRTVLERAFERTVLSRTLSLCFVRGGSFCFLHSLTAISVACPRPW